MRIPLLYKKGGSGSKPENHKYYYQPYCICFLAFDPTRDEGCHSHSEAKMTKNVLRYKIKLFHASVHGALQADTVRKQPIAHRIWLNKKVAVIVLFLKCIKKKVFWDFKSILEISDEMPSIFFPTLPFFFFFGYRSKGERIQKWNTKYPLFSSSLFTEATQSYTPKVIMELIGITINVITHGHLGLVQSRNHSSSRYENTE